MCLEVDAVCLIGQHVRWRGPSSRDRVFAFCERGEQSRTRGREPSPLVADTEARSHRYCAFDVPARQVVARL